MNISNVSCLLRRHDWRELIRAVICTIKLLNQSNNYSSLENSLSRSESNLLNEPTWAGLTEKAETMTICLCCSSMQYQQMETPYFKPT